MARYLRKYDCEDCGRPTERNRSSHQSLVCEPCGTKRMTKSAIQQVAREGPLYDNWVTGMQRHAARLAVQHRVAS